MRPSATCVCRLKLLVYAALSYSLSLSLSLSRSLALSLSVHIYTSLCLFKSICFDIPKQALVCVYVCSCRCVPTCAILPSQSLCLYKSISCYVPKQALACVCVCSCRCVPTCACFTCFAYAHACNAYALVCVYVCSCGCVPTCVCFTCFSYAYACNAYVRMHTCNVCTYAYALLPHAPLSYASFAFALIVHIIPGLVCHILGLFCHILGLFLTEPHAGVLLHAPRARALSAKKSTLLGPSRVCVVDAPLARPLLRVSTLPFSFFFGKYLCIFEFLLV